MDQAALRAKAVSFPDRPGVYVMFDADGREIYVGKARSLVRRVRSYFHRGRSRDAKTMALMDAVREIACTRTDSEVEALLLESRLVKALQPRFNIDLKWGERYPWLAVVQPDDFARVTITREADTASGAAGRIIYMSRFTAVAELRAGIDLLQRIFRFRTCGLAIRADDPRRRYARPCLLYHIRRCTGPCAGHIDREAYAADISRLVRFLEGDKEGLLAEIDARMRAAAAERRYEEAARLRDEAAMLRHVAGDGGVIDEGAALPAPFVEPDAALEELARRFGLKRRPVRIEGVDIAHTAGTHHTGSVVVFINGLPFKEGYRRFRIKAVDAGGDPAMIAEVVRRRLKRLVAEGEEPPDLMLIDGGKVQVAAAARAADEVTVAVRPFLVGLAKRAEVLYPEGAGRGIRLPTTSPALKLLCNVRDEAHRFARLYHTLLRRKSFLGE
ncbi:MAG: GIY-YIG nuclease family protein [Planctomycetota bacterium]